MVDRNLFLHDLAIVAIMKNEGPYLKEWLDYHLAAGVEHFYIYDNESPDNQAEIAAPYVKAGLVDYIPAPGKGMQMPVYIDAVKRFKFQARYMAFIDGDEFIFPKTNRPIAEVVDEILSGKPNAAGVAVNWHCFGSNGHEAADYSKGVLERFTRRAPSDWAPDGLGNAHVKTISNPRKVNFIGNPHFANYFEGLYSVNERGGIVQGPFNQPVAAEKIVINHYFSKSREEFSLKQNRGRASVVMGNRYVDELFDVYNRNEEFDDGILHYRDERAKNFLPPDKSHAAEKLLNALMANLSPTLLPSTPPEFFAGKMETFLTCRAVAAYLRTQLPDDSPAKFFEEVALKAMLRSFDGMSFADARLFLRELPTLLMLPYPVVADIRRAAFHIIPLLMNTFRINIMWRDYAELDYIRDLLKLTEADNFAER
ncbi:MAG: glycosyltransferase family 92 protein [Quinella sp. 2Q5]|nr:glycosyltransferase family 92 protein [Quinella sp. 2Q5]